MTGILLLITVILAMFEAETSAQTIPVKSFPAFGEAFNVRMSPDARLLAIFDNGNIHGEAIIAPYLPVRMYDVTTGQAVVALSGEMDYAADVAFSADGVRFAALYATG